MIDPSIPLQARPARVDWMGDFATGMALKRRADDGAREDAVRQALSSSGGDLKAALPGVWQADPVAGMQIQDRITATEQRDASAKQAATRAQIENGIERLNAAARLVGMATPENWSAVKAELPQYIGAELAASLPETLTRETQMQLLRLGMDAKAQFDAMLKESQPVELNKDTALVDPRTGAELARGPVSTPTPPTPSFDSENVLLDGKPAMVSFDQRTGRYTVGDQDVTARVRPIPPREPKEPVERANDYQKYLQRFAREKGKAVDDLTAAEEIDARTAYEGADYGSSGGRGKPGGDVYWERDRAEYRDYVDREGSMADDFPTWRQRVKGRSEPTSGNALRRPPVQARGYTDPASVKAGASPAPSAPAPAVPTTPAVPRDPKSVIGKTVRLKDGRLVKVKDVKPDGSLVIE